MEKSIDLRKPDGFFVVREVFKIVFFFRKSHTELAKLISETFESCLQTVPSGGLSLFSSASGDWLEYDVQGLRRQVNDRLLGKDAAINGAITVAEGSNNIPDFLFEYEGFALEVPRFRERAGFFQFWMPPHYFVENRERVEKIIMQWCVRLPFSFGYAALALEGNQQRKQGLARRYLALDIGDPSCIARDLADNAAGCYWMNILGNSLSREFGDETGLRKSLPETCRIAVPAPGKTLISLAPDVGRGDRHHNESVANYAAFSRLLDAKGRLHTPSAVIYFEDEEDVEDREAQRRWHRRFL